LFLRAEHEDDVCRGIEYAQSIGAPVFILGGGSNIVVSDSGFDGLVIQIAISGVSIEDETVNAGAGEDWDPVVARSVESGLAGLECLSGIPGTVGGTPVQNVGAYGQEVSETIVSVRCYDRHANKVVALTNEQCRFSYRRSIFNSTERERYVVMNVTYGLAAGGPPRVTYKDVINAVATTEPNLRSVRQAVLDIRRSKSMVIDPNDPNRRSAGSFFKNPVISAAEFDRIRNIAETDVPNFPQDDGRIKVPAAWLIENSGFYKGYELGKAGISTNHTLAIVNRGEATAQEIVELKDRIQDSVWARFEIELVPEPIFVGDF